MLTEDPYDHAKIGDYEVKIIYDDWYDIIEVSKNDKVLLSERIREPIDFSRLTDSKLRAKVGDAKMQEILQERERLFYEHVPFSEIHEREDKIYKPY